MLNVWVATALIRGCVDGSYRLHSHAEGWNPAGLRCVKYSACREPVTWLNDLPGVN